MKKMKFFLSCLSMLALAVSFTACDNDDPVDPVEEVPAPVVTLEAGEAGETSLAFTLTTEKAKEAAWVCVEKGTTVTAEQVLADGTAAEVNKTLELAAENLTANTEYAIYAAAKNGTKLTLSNALEMKTLEAVAPTPDPTVTLKAGEIGVSSVAFTVTSENAEEVKWQIVAKGTELKAEDVLANGEAVEANAAVECLAEELTAETEYDIYAAAKAGEKVVLSSVLSVKTLKDGDEPVTPPTVSVAAVAEKVTAEAVAFTVTSENAEEVKYAVIPEMALGIYGEITAELIYNQAMETVEPNTTVEVVYDVYMAETLFYVYAVAKAGEQLVLSEPAQITTLASQGGGTDEGIELPEAVYSSMTLVQGTSTDKYTFLVADELGGMTLQFDLYTETGLKGNIPEQEYPFAGAEAGMIDLSTLNLYLDGYKKTIEDGMLFISLYESADSQSGWNALIEGELWAEGEELPYLLSYDGLIDRFGIPKEGSDDVETIAFTSVEISRPTEDDGVTPVAGQFNLFLMEGNTRVTLCFRGQDKTYLAGDYYAVGQNASVAGPTGAWVDSELSSVETGVPPIPEQLDGGTGTEYYVRVETMLDLEPTDANFQDYYAIEFYIKTKGLYSTPRVIKGTYNGPLGFGSGGQIIPTVELYYGYFSNEVSGSTSTLKFTNANGGALSLNVAGELPTTESSEWTKLDIQGGSIVEPWMGNGTVNAAGKLCVKFLGNNYDGSSGNTYPEYLFYAESPSITIAGEEYTAKNEWRAYCSSSSSVAPEPQEVDLVFTTGSAVTSADGTRTEVEMTDGAGNSAHLVFRLSSIYANYFQHLYGSGMAYMLGTESQGMEMWTEAAESTITYGGKTYKLPAADQENELYYGFNVTCGMPYADQNAITLIMPITIDDLTLNSFTFSGSLYASGSTVEKPLQDWSKVASGYKNMYVESNGTSHKVTLNSFSNGDMVFFIEGVESIYSKKLVVGTDITKDSYLYQPAIELDDEGTKAPIVSGYIQFIDKGDGTVTVYTGYEGEKVDGVEGDYRLKFETPTNIVWFDSGDKGWTATLK